MGLNGQTAAVLIPTYRPGERFAALLEMLGRQTYPVKQVVVMNTEERYWDDGFTGRIGGMEVRHVSREEFDHGGTRHLGMGCVNTDFCVCMTQDAVPADEFLIEELGGALYGDSPVQVAVASARQLPWEDCGVIERYTRSFNYPETGRVKTKRDLKTLGIKTYFSSDVCAAYNMEIYRKLGGFVRKAIFNEDMIFAAGAIQAGYGVAYAAGARVYHSHNYTNVQQLRRNFDLAVSQADHPEVFGGLPSEGEGIRLVKQTANYLIENKMARLLPELVVKSGFKYIGYQLGKHYKLLPRSLARAFSMDKNYWR